MRAFDLAFFVEADRCLAKVCAEVGRETERGFACVNFQTSFKCVTAFCRLCTTSICSFFNQHIISLSTEYRFNLSLLVLLNHSDSSPHPRNGIKLFFFTVINHTHS